MCDCYVRYTYILYTSKQLDTHTHTHPRLILVLRREEGFVVDAYEKKIGHSFRCYRKVFRKVARWSRGGLSPRWAEPIPLIISLFPQTFLVACKISIFEKWRKITQIILPIFPITGINF